MEIIEIFQIYVIIKLKGFSDSPYFIFSCVFTPIEILLKHAFWQK